jgi:hypothetical protein
VSAVDAPPGVALADIPAGEFASTIRSQRFSRRVLVYVAAASAATMIVAARRWHAPLVELLFVVPMVCLSVAAVGHAVRRARLRIDGDGVRWGWRVIGFRLRRDRVARASAFADAVAIRPRRGATWYLCRRDWARFEGVAGALEATGIAVTRSRDRAPLGARLQSYGLALDILLLASAAAVSVALLVAMTL